MDSPIKQISQIPGCADEKNSKYDAETRKCMIKKRADRTRSGTQPITIPPVVCKAWRPEAWKVIPTSPHHIPCYKLPQPPAASRTWNCFKLIDDQKMVLHGSCSLSSRRYGIMSCGKQSSAISIVALGFKKIFPVSKWISSDMDRILDEGTKLYKRTIVYSKLKRGSLLKPNEVFCNFYIDTSKIITNAGKDVIDNVFENCQLETDLEKFLKLYKSCIFYAADKNFAIWKTNDNAYYIFNAYDTDKYGNTVPITKGACCCLRLLSLKLMVEYLNSILKLNFGKYELYSVDILKVENLSEQTSKTVEDIQSKSLSGPELLSRSESKLFTRPKTVPMIKEARMSIFNFSSDFVRISETGGILRASKFINEAMKVPAINLAALIMLRNFRTLTWDTQKMDEILDMGLQLYDKNVANSNVVIFGDQNYTIDSTQIVIGEIVSTKANVCDLLTGLREFFKLYDTGLLQGPQNIGIWQEAGYYFMFDPKERNKFGGKFFFGNVELSMASPKPEYQGKACLTWFTKLNDLVEVYVANVPQKYHFDPYRLTKIEIEEVKIKSDDWFDWKSFDYNKWILRGLFSQNNKRFCEENRNRQATCMSLIALVFSNIVSLSDWNTKVMETIMDIGDALYSKCLQVLKESENFVDHHLQCQELIKFFSFESYRIEFKIEECVVNGMLGKIENNSVEDNTTLTLLNGLREFFRLYDKAILTACNISIALWRSGDYYYCFDSHPRDCEGKNSVTHSKTTGCFGTCCALRCFSLTQLSDHVESNFELSENDNPFNIARIEFMIIEEKSRPELNYYQSLGEKGAILRPIERGLHEGNKNIFDIRANRQTLCNLVVCLALAQINRSVKWSAQYINDILNIGDKMFCRIVKRLGSEIDDNFELTWNELDKEIEIGLNKFTFDFQILRKGIIEEEPSIMSIHSIASSKPDGESNESQINEEAEVGEEELVQIKDIETAVVETASAKGSSGSNRSRLDRLSSSHSRPSSEVERQHKILAKLKANQISGLSNVSHIYNLRSIFSEWDSVVTLYAILQTEALLCAIWKQDNLYFIFDPKGTNDDIKFLPDRVEEVHRKISEKYESENKSRTNLKSMCEIQSEKDNTRACVAWFTTPDDLIDHILSVIPEEFAYRIFTLYKIDFTTDLLETVNNQQGTVTIDNFTFIDESVSIIRGSMSQNFKIFPKFPNRNNQDTTNCVTAITFSLFCDSDDWKSTTVDVVLKYGDRLYTQSLNFMKKLEPNMNFLQDPKIKLHHLASPYLITNMKFYLTTNALECDTKEVDEKLGELLSEHKSLICECRNYYVAFWNERKVNSAGGDSDTTVYYMFDPHDIGPNGLKRINGAAALYRSENISSLIMYFLKNSGMDKDEIKVYRVQIIVKLLPGRVKLCNAEDIYDHDDFDVDDDNLDYENADHLPSAYSSFKQYDQHSKILIGTMQVHRELSNRDLSCYILAAIITSQIIAPDYWTEITIDELLKLGDRLNTEGSVTDLNENTTIFQQFSKIDVIVDKIADETIDENLSIIMEHFFEDHVIGVYLLTDNIFAIWKNTARYYIFVPPRNLESARVFKMYSTKCFGKVLIDLSHGNSTFTLKKCDVLFKIKK